MFDLEKSIGEWRREMLATGIKTPVPLDELESHLREDVERQALAGADVEQAFRLAAERIGRMDTLRSEFNKLEDANRAQARERLRRWSVVAGVGFVYVMLSGTWYLCTRQGTLQITRVEILFAAGAVAPMVLLGWVGRFVAQRLPVINENWIIAIALAVLFCAALLFRAVFPVVSPTNLVHLQIAVLWCLSPLLGFGNCVSSWHERCEGLRKSAHKQTA